MGLVHRKEKERHDLPPPTKKEKREGEGGREKRKRKEWDCSPTIEIYIRLEDPRPARQKMVNLADRIHCRQDYHLMPGAVRS